CRADRGGRGAGRRYTWRPFGADQQATSWGHVRHLRVPEGADADSLFYSRNADRWVLCAGIFSTGATTDRKWAARSWSRSGTVLLKGVTGRDTLPVGVRYE